MDLVGQGHEQPAGTQRSPRDYRDTSQAMTALQRECDELTSSTASTKYLISIDAGVSCAWRGVAQMTLW